MGSGFLIGSSMSSKNKKTLRHRRNGSGSFATPPKYSPTRDRRYQSEPENRKVQLVERQTQTDAMDVSETDISPSAEHHPNVDVPPPNHRQLPLQLQRVQQMAAVMAQANIQASNPASVSSAANVASPSNGNSLSNSELTYQDACSSPDQLIDDVMNSNERLDITDCCSDNENLERLGRKVIEFINENRLSIQSNSTENGNGGHGSGSGSAGGGSVHSTAAPELRDVGVNSSPCLSRCNSTQSRRQTRQTENTVNGSAVNNANGDSSHEHLGEDSWSDEEGEDTDDNYALRRRR